MARARTNPWLVLLVLTTGFFMIMLDTTIVNVAIPAMSTALNTTLDQILWVLNAYVLVYAVLLITAGRLGDLYGHRGFDRHLCDHPGPPPRPASRLGRHGHHRRDRGTVRDRLRPDRGRALQLGPDRVLPDHHPRGHWGRRSTDGPVHHLGALPGRAASPSLPVCRSQFRGRELDLRGNQLRHAEHVPALHHLPAVGSRFLGPRRWVNAGADVAHLDGHGAVRGPFSGSRRGQVHPDGGDHTVHDRHGHHGVCCRARLDLDQLSRTRDRGRTWHRDDLRADDHSRDAQHRAPRGRRRVRRA